jgi:hypothetical protein
MRRAWTWIFLPLLFFCVATLVLAFPVSLHLTDAALNLADPMLNAWILAWDAHILAQNPLDLYHANDFYPYSNTLAYSETLLGQALFTTPVIWLTGNPILAVNLVWLTSFVLTGVGAYLLVFRFTRRRGAALVAGMILAFTSFRFAHAFHIQVLSIQWMLFAFFFLDRWIGSHQWKDGLGFAVCFNLQVLSSYYYALFITVGVTVLLCGYWLLDRHRFSRRLWPQFLVLIAVTATIQLPLAAPYFKVAKALDFERSLDDAIRGGTDLTDFITTAPENHLYGALTARLRGEGWWEHVTFPGVVTLVLAALGASWGWRKDATWRKPVVVFLPLVAVGLTLSLGPALRFGDQTVFSPLPYRVLFDHVPGFRAIRQPARFHILTMIGLAVLAGIGVAALEVSLRSGSARLRKHWQTWGLVGMLVCLIAVECAAMPFSYARVPLAGQIPPAYRWLAEQPDDGPVLELPILLDVGAVESPRLYYSTYHWKRLVNGYGGFFPPVYAYFLFFDREFPDQPYDWILGLGVRYVILHRWQYDAQELQRIDARMADFQDRLPLVADFGEDQVFEVVQPATGEPNRPLWDSTLDGKAVLLGHVIKPIVAHPGETVEVKLFWQDRAPVTEDYTVFVHILDESGALLTQHDGPPANGERPTSAWEWDQIVLDTHQLQIPQDASPGSYQVRVGMYLLHTMERLPVRTLDGMIDGDFLTLGQLSVAKN